MTRIRHSQTRVPATLRGASPLLRIPFLLLAAALAPLATPGTALAQSETCQPMVERMPLEDRLSPYDSLRVRIGGDDLLVCYGRPSSRGRTMIGGTNVPYGELWRTGANEPTTLHVPFPATIAGIEVEPGSYSLYTVPGPEEWTVIVNASTTQWGHEGQYTPEVEAQEVGRAAVPAGSTESHVEAMTFRGEPGTEENQAYLVLEWESSRIRIPVERR